MPQIPEDHPKIEMDYQEEEEEIDYEVKRDILPSSPADWFDIKAIHDI